MGATIAGPLFAGWGYLHRGDAPALFDAIANVLSIIVPLLFSIGLAGFCAWRTRPAGSLFGKVGAVLAAVSCGWGALYNLAVILGAADTAERYGYAESRGWPPQLLDWFPWFLLGLALMGMAYVRVGSLRVWRFLPLSIGALGWVYYLSDSGSTNQLRTIHVVSGLLFGAGWILLGHLLRFNESGGQTKEPRA